MFQVRKDGFEDNPAVLEEPNLVEKEDVDVEEEDVDVDVEEEDWE